MNRRFHANRFSGMIGLVCLIILMSIMTTVSATEVEPTEPSTDIVSFVSSCFDSDNLGYADAPEEPATLESTINALELLDELNAVNREGLQYEFDLISEYIISKQDAGGGFRSSLDEPRPFSADQSFPGILPRMQGALRHPAFPRYAPQRLLRPEMSFGCRSYISLDLIS